MTTDTQDLPEDDKQFIRSVCYFWEEKGDPTRYVGWDDDRCRQLLPEFWFAWHQRVMSTGALHAACSQAFEEVGRYADE